MPPKDAKADAMVDTISSKGIAASSCRIVLLIAATIFYRVATLSTPSTTTLPAKVSVGMPNISGMQSILGETSTVAAI
jgi:hypothetical protein